MKRAFWFDETYMDQQIEEVDTTITHAVHFAKKYNNKSISENGATGYRSTGSALADLNFKVSSLRNRSEDFITNEFIKAYHESPVYAVKWMFFLRDILEGMGERRSFRICLKYLAVSQPEIAKAVLRYIPMYGRYDDGLVLIDTPLCEDIAAMYKKQLVNDLAAMKEGKPVSLLGKWLPSENTSSSQTRTLAGKLRRSMGFSSKEYRKALSELRSYSHVLETRLSASAWSEIDYQTVPAKANLKYEAAFVRHDAKRRAEYLEKVFLGDDQLNANGIMPYEITHMITGKGFSRNGLKPNLLAELMWNKLVSEGFHNTWNFEDAIVVADGSGSMLMPASGSTSVTALEICNSLAIYFAQQLKGVFRNKAITFSGHPQFIDLKEDTTLKDKLEIMRSHNECANTNVEAVFDLILHMALEKTVPREELPKQVLIISDMEFDTATCSAWWNNDIHWKAADQTLFDSIAAKYREYGYVMPRLIFWNVCGRTDTIPMVDNNEGLCLLSGFSQNAMKIAANKVKKDPYEALIEVLDSPRYQVIGDAIQNMVA